MSDTTAKLQFEIDSSQAQRAISVLETLRATSISLTGTTNGLRESNVGLTQSYAQERDSLTRLVDQTKSYDGTLTGLVGRLTETRKGISGVTEEFRTYTGYLREAAAVSTSLNTTVDALDRYVNRAKDLRLSTADLATGLQRITAALQNQTVAGHETRVTLERLGIPLSGISANRPEQVLQQLADRLRQTRDTAAKIDITQEVLGPSADARTVRALEAQPTPTYNERQARERRDTAAGQIDSQQVEIERRANERQRNERERADLDSRFTQSASVLGRLGLGGGGGIFQSANAQREALRQIERLPAEQRQSQELYAYQANEWLNDRRPIPESVQGVLRSAAAVPVIGPSLAAAGAAAPAAVRAYRNFASGTYRSNQQEIAERAADEREDAAWLSPVPTLTQFGRNVQNLVGAYTPTLQQDPREITREEQRRLRLQSGNILAQEGDPELAIQINAEQALQRLNRSDTRQRYTAGFGADQGARLFRNQQGQREQALRYAQDPAERVADETQRQRQLLEFAPEQRERAAFEQRFTEQQGVAYERGTGYVPLAQNARLSETQRDAGARSFQQQLGGQLQQGTEDVERQIRFQKGLADTLKEGRAAAEDYTRAEQARMAVAMKSGDVVQQQKAAEDALRLARQQRETQSTNLITSMRGETAAVGTRLEQTEATVGGDPVTRQTAQITAGIQQDQSKLIRDGLLLLQDAHAYARERRTNVGQEGVQEARAVTGGAADTVTNAQRVLTIMREQNVAQDRARQLVAEENMFLSAIAKARAEGTARTKEEVEALRAKTAELLKQANLDETNARQAQTQQELERNQQRLTTTGGNEGLDPIARGRLAAEARLTQEQRRLQSIGQLPPGTEERDAEQRRAASAQQGLEGVRGVVAGLGDRARDAGRLVDIMREQGVSQERAAAQLAIEVQLRQHLVDLGKGASEAAQAEVKALMDQTAELQRQTAIQESLARSINAGREAGRDAELERRLRSLPEREQQIQRQLEPYRRGAEDARQPITRAGELALPESHVPIEGQQLIRAILPSEARSWNQINGGGTFDTSQGHPNLRAGNVGRGIAAGGLQFMPDTWRDGARLAGVDQGNMSPSNQMDAGWEIAKRDYRRNTGGRDLQVDLRDPQNADFIIHKLNTTWTSLAGNPREENSAGAAAPERLRRLITEARTTSATTTTPVTPAATAPTTPMTSVGVNPNAPVNPAAGTTATTESPTGVPRETEEQFRQRQNDVQRTEQENERRASDRRLELDRQRRALPNNPAERERLTLPNPLLEPDVDAARRARERQEVISRQGVGAADASNATTQNTQNLERQTAALKEGGAAIAEVDRQLRIDAEVRQLGADNVNRQTRALELQTETLAKNKNALAERSLTARDDAEVQRAGNDAGVFASRTQIEAVRERARLEQEFRRTPGLRESPEGQRAIQDIADKKVLTEQTERMNELRDAARSTGSAISSALEAIVVHGEKGKPVLKALGEQLATIAFRTFVEKPLERGINGIFDSLTGEGGGSGGSGANANGATGRSGTGGLLSSAGDWLKRQFSGESAPTATPAAASATSPLRSSPSMSQLAGSGGGLIGDLVDKLGGKPGFYRNGGLIGSFFNSNDNQPGATMPTATTDSSGAITNGADLLNAQITPDMSSSGGGTIDSGTWDMPTTTTATTDMSGGTAGNDNGMVSGLLSGASTIAKAALSSQAAGGPPEQIFAKAVETFAQAVGTMTGTTSAGGQSGGLAGKVIDNLFGTSGGGATKPPGGGTGGQGQGGGLIGKLIGSFGSGGGGSGGGMVDSGTWDTGGDYGGYQGPMGDQGMTGPSGAEGAAWDASGGGMSTNSDLEGASSLTGGGDTGIQQNPSYSSGAPPSDGGGFDMAQYSQLIGSMFGSEIGKMAKAMPSSSSGGGGRGNGCCCGGGGGGQGGMGGSHGMGGGGQDEYTSGGIQDYQTDYSSYEGEGGGYSFSGNEGMGGFYDMSGGGGGGFDAGSMGGAYAKGGVFPSRANDNHVNTLAAFENQVVDRPTVFRFASGGAVGQMGEAGEEAIVPLTRGPDGKLGVKQHGGGGGGSGGAQVVMNITTPDANSFRNSRSQIDAKASYALNRTSQRNNY